jgi:hypothetical protein
MSDGFAWRTKWSITGKLSFTNHVQQIAFQWSHTIKVRTELFPGDAAVCFAVGLVELNVAARLVIVLLLLLLLLLLHVHAADSRGNQCPLRFPTHNLKEQLSPKPLQCIVAIGRYLGRAIKKARWSTNASNSSKQCDKRADKKFQIKHAPQN